MSKVHFALSTLTAAVIAASLPAFAQDTSSGKASVFEEVIVTAKKRSESIYDVPVAMSAFTSDMIERQGISDLIDVGKFVPNLTVTSFSAGHSSAANPFIRGIGLQDHLITTDPGVGVYIDGVYLGRQIGQNWSLSNIERMEILRGPQGTLYGRNSIGGAINIITKKPGDENGGRITARVGDRGRTNFDILGNVRFSDDLAVSVSGAYKKRDGLGDFNNLDTSTEVGEMEDLSGRLSVYWTPTENLAVSFTADANDGENGLNPYTAILLPPLLDLGLLQSDISRDPYDNNTGTKEVTQTESTSDGIALTIDYTISEELSAKFLASSRSSDYKAGVDDDASEIVFLQFPEMGYADQESYEIQLMGDFGDFDFVSGIYYFEEDGENDQPNAVFNGGFSSELLQQEVESIAVYGNVGFQFTDELRVAGGLRYTEDEKDARVVINGFIEATGSETFDDLSWDLSATYDLNDNLTTYAAISSGFQSGQFPPRPFCLFGDFFGPGGGVETPASNCFNQELDNITALNYELGIKGQPFETLQMSVAIFYTEYEDLPYQISTTEGGGFNTSNEIVDQESTGIEWESSWAAFEGFYLNTSLGYMDVDVDSDNDSAVAPLTPDLTAAVGGDYTMNVGAGGSVTFHADYSFRDSMYGEPTDDKGRDTEIDSRYLVNFDISYLSSDETWQIGLYGKNVTDERYENARINTSDEILVIMSNDASEFGIRGFYEF
jgi:iron complex outermembrane receptor protein